MITNSDVASGLAQLYAEFHNAEISEAELAAGITALLNQWNQQISVGGLALKVGEMKDRYDAKWSAFLDLDFKGVLNVFANLPTTGNQDGDAYLVRENTTGVPFEGHPNGQLFIWVGNFWDGQGSDWTLGKTGPAGPAGESAYQRAVANGYVGSEVAWLASLNGTGNSAYEDAVANGYVGSLESWLASLNGVAPWTTATPWANGTSYSATAPASVVVHNGSSYLCLVSHTSGVFATDLAANKWRAIVTKGDTGDVGPPAPCVVTCVVTPAIGAESTVVVVDGAGFVPIPASYNGKNLVSVIATVTTPSSSGDLTIQLRRSRGNVDMLSTPITIVAGQNSSTSGGAAQPVVNTANDDVVTGDLVFIDVDAAGTDAKGLAVTATYG